MHYKNLLTTAFRFLVIIILFLILYIMLIPLLKYSTAWAEALMFPYFSPIRGISSDSFLQIFLANDHSWILHSVIVVITNKYMPLLLHMHHQDYMAQYNIWVILICYLFFLLSVQFHFEKYFKNKLLSIFSVFLIFPILLIFQSVSNGAAKLWWFNQDCWFYAAILLPIFPIMLYTKLEKDFVLNQNLSGKDYIKSFILMFFTAFGHEFFRAVVLFSFPLIFIFNNIFLKKKIGCKSFLKSYISVIFINALIFLNPVTLGWFANKKRTLQQCIEIFVPYMKEYFQVVIMNNIYLFVAIFVLSVTGFFISAKTEQFKKLLVVSYSVLLSVLMFNIAIIFGKENFEFSFNHYTVLFFTKTTLFCIVLSLSGYIISLFKNIYGKIIFLVSLLFLSTCYILSNIDCFDTREEEKMEKLARQKRYLMEKMFYLYGKENKKIYVFNDPINYFFKYEFLYQYDNLKNIPKFKLVKIEDDIEVFKSLIKEKTGVTVTEEELEETKFSNISGR